MAAIDVHAADPIVCRCLGVSQSEIRCALLEGTADCLSSVMSQTGAGTGCNCCHRAIRELLARERFRAQLIDQCEGSGSSPTCVTR
jgi:bacterioferritin-associated ferredoxin